MNTQNTQQHDKHTLSISEKVIVGLFCLGYTVSLLMWLHLI